MAFKNGSILRLGFFFEGIFETREGRRNFFPYSFRARTIDEFNGRMETRLKGEPNILYTQQSNIHRFGRSTREDTRLWVAPLPLSVETKALSKGLETPVTSHFSDRES